MGEDLGRNNIQQHGQWAVLRNFLHDEGKARREETIHFDFRSNILSDLYQAERIVNEIKERKQKFPSDYSKSFSKVNWHQSNLEKIYCMNFFVLQQFSDSKLFNLEFLAWDL